MKYLVYTVYTIILCAHCYKERAAILTAAGLAHSNSVYLQITTAMLYNGFSFVCQRSLLADSTGKVSHLSVSSSVHTQYKMVV